MPKKRRVNTNNGYSYYRKTKDGKTFYARDAKEWQDKYDAWKMEQEAVYALNANSKTATIKQLWPEFKISTTVEMRDRTTPSPNTLEERVVVFEKVLPVLGDVRLSKLTDKQVFNFYKGINDYCIANIRSSVLEHTYKVFQAFLKWAVRSQYIREIPISPRTLDMVQVWIANHKDMRPAREFEVTEQVIHEVLNEVKDKPYEIIFLLWAYTGMRFNEALVRTWDDVDIPSSTIQVTSSKTDVGKKAMVGTKFENGSSQIVTAPKTKAGIRSVHLHQAITELLENIPQDARTGYLYGTRKGTPVNGSTFRGRVFKPLMLKLGYPGIRPNDFRHYCITDLTNFAIKAQIDLKCVSDMVGHANVSTTLDIYNESRSDQNQRLGMLLANRNRLSAA